MSYLLNKMSIKAKLFVISGILLIMLGMTTYYAFYSMGAVSDEMESVTKHDLPLTGIVTKITEYQLEQSVQFERALRFSGLKLDDSERDTKLRETVAHFDDLDRDVAAQLKEAEQLVQSEEARTKDAQSLKEFEAVKSWLDRIESEHKEFAADVHAIFVHIENGHMDKAVSVAEKVALKEKQLGKEVEELLNEIEHFVENSGEVVLQHEQTALFTVGLIVAISLFVGLVSTWLVVRSIIVSLREGGITLRHIASGDLTKRYEIKSHDELGRMLEDMNNMADSLTDMVSEVIASSNSISVAAEEVSQGNLNLSQRTEEQASSLEETASSMEEMTSTVRQSADNALQASKLAQDARSQAERGGEVVGKAVSAMSGITESSKKIAEIISVIDEIAFQTNLLALNAAVEAARAGEQGRGFAVVASEVRNLAGRSAESAKEIKNLIMDSVSRVEEGSDLVSESGKTLEEIVVSVKKVTDIVTEMAAASQEQSAGIEQVNKAVMQMDEMTQQNAALVEEGAAASRSLEEQAMNLVNVMSRFKTNMSLEHRTVSSRSTFSSTKAETRHWTEKRSPNRPFSEKTAKPANSAHSQQKDTVQKTGTDDDWSEF